MTSVPRAMPRLDAVNRPFWTGGASGELKLMQCADCAAFVHPPRPLCPKCLSENVAPQTMAGTGVIDTFTINYQKWHPALEVPFVIARVAIDGAPGVYLTSNIVGCPVEEVEIGDRVSVTFLQQGEVYLPLFEKVS
jgi:uncharacterized OB-fold protein